MKPNQLNLFTKLSQLQSLNDRLFVTSTRMDFEKNRYRSEIWHRKDNRWDVFKSGEELSFSSTKINTLGDVVFLESNLDKNKKDNKFRIVFQKHSSDKSKDVFISSDPITNFAWVDDENIFVVVENWNSKYKEIKEKESEPKYIENLPFRYDNIGDIFNKKSQLLEVNIKSKTVKTIADTEKTDYLSIQSAVKIKNTYYFLSSKHNKQGTELEDDVLQVKGRKLEAIFKGGSFGKLLNHNNELLTIGLKNYMDWPEAVSIYKIENSKVKKLFTNLDRTVVDIKSFNGELYFTFEDSGKVCVAKSKDLKNIEILYNEEAVCKDFVFDEKLLCIIEKPTCPGEIYEVGDNVEQISLSNSWFKNNVKLHKYVYERVDTKQSKVDAWGILVNPNNPTLLNIHGGPASQYGFGFFDEFQVYASAGFNVIFTNPRGSSGRGTKWLKDVCNNKWGVADTHDVLTSFDFMIKKLRIKNKKFGIMGGSYGGFMTSWIIGHYNKKFHSAIVERALINWETMVGTSDIGIGFPEMYLGTELDKNRNFYLKKSPITYANKIKTPTLIIHSENDFRCPIEQAEQLFSQLKRNEVPSAMVRFPGEGHELSRSGSPKHREQRFNFIIDWHKKHLK